MPSIISVGISESLLADFEALRDTSSVSGKKYHTKTIDRLSQYICCRNYAKLSLELCYLVWAVVNYKRDSAALLNFFWIDEAITPSAFRKAFEHSHQAEWLPSDSKIYIDEMGLCIQFKYSKFVISATRISLLSAFLELLTTHIHHLLDELEANLMGADEKSIKQHANTLQKQIYDWLKAHLPSAKVQQRFRHIEQWTQKQAPEGKFDDHKVIRFWQDSRDIDGYVKYTSALEDVIDYELAKKSLLQAHEAQHALSLDEYAQIVSQDEISLYESASNIFEAFEKTPLSSTPKFLSSKQIGLVLPHITVANLNDSLPLSAWRASVFGQWQSQLIQLSRSTQIQDKTHERSHPIESYETHYQQLVSLKKAIKLTLLSCVAVLYNKKSLACLSVLDWVLQDLIDAAQLSALRLFFQANITEESAKGTNELFVMLKRWQLEKPVLNKVFNLAQDALRKNNKQGFKDWHKYDEDAYLEGSQQLVNLDVLVTKAISTFVSSVGETTKEISILEACVVNFSADLCIFTEELKLRHRGAI